MERYPRIPVCLDLFSTVFNFRSLTTFLRWLTWNHMGVKMSKRYSLHNSYATVCKINGTLVWLFGTIYSKTFGVNFGNFNFKQKCLKIKKLLNMGPYGQKNPLLQRNFYRGSMWQSKQKLDIRISNLKCKGFLF